MFPWPYNVYVDPVMKEVKEWRLLGLQHADDLVLGDDSEEDLKVMVGHFVEVFRRRDLKVNANKRKGMVIGGEERLEYAIRVDMAQLEQV